MKRAKVAAAAAAARWSFMQPLALFTHCCGRAAAVSRGAFVGQPFARDGQIYMRAAS